MDKILIVGSGASGVHFALSVLRKGYEVTMLDVGYQRPPILHPQENLHGLREKLCDPLAYFLGNRFEAFIPPADNSEYYGIPPNKNYVLARPRQFTYSSSSFDPLFSFAQGGLAEAWTGGCYPLNAQEISDFPFSYDELSPCYDEVAERIGISGAQDDLARFYPFHRNIEDPLTLDQHSRLLLSTYQKKKERLNNKFDLYIGHSRMATLSRDQGTRKACTYSGRCLWGCPTGALYTPSLTLAECKTFANFTYVPEMYVKYFKWNGEKLVTSVIAESVKDGKHHEFCSDKIVLAAGTLSSSRIFLQSLWRKTGNTAKLRGLMDNRQVLVPFVNLRMAGFPTEPENYQYHQLAMGLRKENPKDYIHGQITTLKSALLHPIIQQIPFDLKSAVYFFRNFHSALGLLNLNFSDSRRENNYVSLGDDPQGSHTTLCIHYTKSPQEKHLIHQATKIVRSAFRKLGCVVMPGTVHVRPMGASVHYSGTIPMSDSGASLTTTKDCQSNDFKNLYIVDGATFPFLPAKNLTFTLMANAVRVAGNAF